MPPGTNPDGTAQGPRLPLITVSAYVRPGYTANTRTTYAAVLAYIEHTFGLSPHAGFTTVFWGGRPAQGQEGSPQGYLLARRS